MVCVGRDLGDLLIQILLTWAETRLPKSLFNLALNTSRDEPSATSLCNLFQYFTTLQIKNFFLTSNLKLYSFYFNPLAAEACFCGWSLWAGWTNLIKSLCRSSSVCTSLASPVGCVRWLLCRGAVICDLWFSACICTKWLCLTNSFCEDYVPCVLPH